LVEESKEREKIKNKHTNLNSVENKPKSLFRCRILYFVKNIKDEDWIRSHSNGISI
jgi:hypothetical protein